MTDRILIVDFGSQVTQLIARRVREIGVYSEIHPFNKVTEDSIRDFDPKGVILSGGPASVHHTDTPRAPDGLFDMGLPVLGICYGEMTMCAQLGGEVVPTTEREFGRAFVDVMEDCPLYEGIWQPGEKYQVWMSHGDKIVQVPPGFRAVASSDSSPFAVITHEIKPFYGVQFHPEVVHTLEGAQLLKNFVHKIAGCAGDWTMANFREEVITKIRKQVGDGNVICGLSGGVDSSVAAVLIHEAIGDQLTCIFVDHGLLRQGEAEQVVETFRDRFNIKLFHRDASDLFIGELEGKDDPEEKRKIIGRLFIEVFEEEAAKIGGADFLAQGTLYPSRCYRVRFLHGWAERHHQIASQRRRIAGTYEYELG